MVMRPSAGGRHGETGISGGVPSPGAGSGRDRAADQGDRGRFELSEQTIYSWRRQDRIDQGLEPGLSSTERAELIAARTRIRELEAEVAVHRRATELLRGDGDPKGGSRRSNG